jgi:Fe-Mn family superoxide dismutase
MMSPAMTLALDANFGSVDRWREAFVALDNAQASGLRRRVLLVFQPRGALVNRAVSAGPAHAVSDGVPILVWDSDAAGEPGPSGHSRVEDFLDHVDWAAVQDRYRHAVFAASEACAAGADELDDAARVDVRRAGAFDKAASMLPGAVWRDPADVAAWAGELASARAVVVYCVYGHEVSRATALRLCAAGVNARFLRGGIDGWEAEGRAVAVKGVL